MAGYGNPGTGSDDDYFSDAPAKPEAQEQESEPEGILPKALMAGKNFKVGDEIVLQVTRVGENDFSVKYAPAENSDHYKEESGAGEKAEAPPTTDMASMME
jgi:hypothetical protein